LAECSREKASELVGAAPARARRRDSISDRQRKGSYPESAKGKSSAFERGALQGSGGKQPGHCVHVLDGRRADVAELGNGGNAGVSGAGPGGPTVNGSDGRERGIDISGMPCRATGKGRMAGYRSAAPQRRILSQDCVAKPADGHGARAALYGESRCGYNRTIRGRRSAAD